MSASESSPRAAPDTPLSIPGRTTQSNSAPAFTHRDVKPNVPLAERTGSGAAGVLLLAWAAGRRGVLPMLAALGGAGLLWRAATGRCAMKRALQPSPYEREVAQTRNWPTAAVAQYAVTISRPREEVYRFWRDFANLPSFMSHVERVEIITPHRSRWTVKAPLERTVQWVSYVMEDVENERIAWEAEAQADIPNAGWVEFRDAPAGRGTEVHAQICYCPPYGNAGRLLSRLTTLEAPSNQVADDLRRLKQVLETGDVATSLTRPHSSGAI